MTTIALNQDSITQLLLMLLPAGSEVLYNIRDCCYSLFIPIPGSQDGYMETVIPREYVREASRDDLVRELERWIQDTLRMFQPVQNRVRNAAVTPIPIPHAVQSSYNAAGTRTPEAAKPASAPTLPTLPYGGNRRIILRRKEDA